jgi:hypothetical protein
MIQQAQEEAAGQWRHTMKSEQTYKNMIRLLHCGAEGGNVH